MRTFEASAQGALCLGSDLFAVSQGMENLPISFQPPKLDQRESHVSPVRKSPSVFNANYWLSILQGQAQNQQRWGLCGGPDISRERQVRRAGEAVREGTFTSNSRWIHRDSNTWNDSEKNKDRPIQFLCISPSSKEKEPVLPHTGQHFPVKAHSLLRV